MLQHVSPHFIGCSLIYILGRLVQALCSPGFLGAAAIHPVSFHGRTVEHMQSRICCGESCCEMPRNAPKSNRFYLACELRLCLWATPHCVSILGDWSRLKPPSQMSINSEIYHTMSIYEHTTKKLHQAKWVHKYIACNFFETVLWAHRTWSYKEHRALADAYASAKKPDSGSGGDAIQQQQSIWSGNHVKHPHSSVVSWVLANGFPVPEGVYTDITYDIIQLNVYVFMYIYIYI